MFNIFFNFELIKSFFSNQTSILILVFVILITIFLKDKLFSKNKSKPKIIGVISDYSLNKTNQHSYSFQPIHIIREQYINNIHSACANYNVALIIIPIDSNQINKFAQIVDGVIFTGGGDVDSKLFNQEKHPTVIDETEERTEFEVNFCKKILELKKPILAICRGMQLVNVVLGGDIIQDIPSYIKTNINHKAVKNGVGYLDNVHTVETYENSLIRKIVNKKEFWVNSNHHQALDKLGKNIKVTGVSPKDNIIEVIEFKNYPSFFLGIQWHPEFAHTEEDKMILRYFCKSL
jgi:putative glutamine amidotransferase